MQLRSVALLAIICIILNSCKKGTDDTATTNTKVHLISTVVGVSTGNIETMTYKYDDKNRLIELSSSLQYFYKYQYDNSDRIIQYDYINNSNGYSSQSLYSYDTPGIVNSSGTSKVNNTNQTTPALTVFNVNSKYQPTKSTFGSGGYTDYAYDDKGNLLTQTSYSTANATTPSTKTTYTYDDQRNAFGDAKGIMINLLQTSVNNPKSQTLVNYQPNNTTNTFTNTFEYNADGYPTKQTTLQTSSTSTAVNTTVYTISYVVK